jgi:hypothetical protein
MQFCCIFASTLEQLDWYLHIEEWGDSITMIGGITESISVSLKVSPGSVLNVEKYKVDARGRGN